MSEDEEYIETYHTTRLAFLPYYILIFLFLGAGIAVNQMGFPLMSSAPPLILGFLGLIGIEIKAKESTIRLGEDDFIVETGILSKDDTRLHYTVVGHINVRQGLLQRLLNYGDVEIGIPGSTLQFAGSGEVKIESPTGRIGGLLLENFQSPKEIQSIIQRKMKEKKKHEHDHSPPGQ